MAINTGYCSVRFITTYFLADNWFMITENLNTLEV